MIAVGMESEVLNRWEVTLKSLKEQGYKSSGEYHNEKIAQKEVEDKRKLGFKAFFILAPSCFYQVFYTPR